MTKWNPEMWEKIREKRKKKNLSMKKLGDVVGCSEAHISRIERGLVTVNPQIMDKIHEVLGL